MHSVHGGQISGSLEVPYFEAFSSLVGLGFLVFVLRHQILEATRN